MKIYTEFSKLSNSDALWKTTLERKEGHTWPYLANFAGEVMRAES